MKKLTGFSVTPSAEGKRVYYTYSEIDSDGNVTSSNVRGSYVALDEDVLAALASKDVTQEKLIAAVKARL